MRKVVDMEILYDKEVDALHIQFKKTTVTTKQLSDDLAVDYDSSGKIAGIEILDASENFDLNNVLSFKEALESKKLPSSVKEKPSKKRAAKAG